MHFIQHPLVRLKGISHNKLKDLTGKSMYFYRVDSNSALIIGFKAQCINLNKKTENKQIKIPESTHFLKPVSSTKSKEKASTYSLAFLSSTFNNSFDNFRRSLISVQFGFFCCEKRDNLQVGKEHKIEEDIADKDKRWILCQMLSGKRQSCITRLSSFLTQLTKIHGLSHSRYSLLAYRLPNLLQSQGT